MTGYQFVVRNHDFSRTSATAGFPMEGFEDVTFSAWASSMIAAPTS